MNREPVYDIFDTFSMFSDILLLVFFLHVGPLLWARLQLNCNNVSFTIHSYIYIYTVPSEGANTFDGQY